MLSCFNLEQAISIMTKIFIEFWEEVVIGRENTKTALNLMLFNGFGSIRI